MPAASPAEVSRFLAQLDSIKALPTDTAQSVGLRALYTAAPPPLRRAILKPVLKTASNLLFYHTSADTLLITFYRNVSIDSLLLPQQRAQAAQHLAAFYAHFAGDADSAGFYLARARADTTILNDTARVNIAATQAQVYQLRGELPAAAKEIYRAIALSEKLNDSATIARMQGNLANVYRAMEDFESSIDNRLKALAYFRRKSDDAASFIALTGLVADYVDVTKYDSARIYMAESQALLQKGIVSPVAEYYLNLATGSMYLYQNDYDSAILWFNKAKPILARLQDPVKKLYFTMASAPAYAYRQDVTAEETLIRDAVPQLLADSNLEAVRGAYKSLYKISVSKQKYGSLLDALNYYKRYDSVRNILTDNRNHTHVAEMAARYGAEKQNLIIRLQEREIKRKTALNGALALSAISIILAGSVLVVRMRLRESRRKAKLQELFTTEMLKNTEAERGRIAMDLHDGIGHELLTLKNNLRQSPDNNESHIDAILNHIRRMSRNLHPVMLDKIGLEHSIYALCEQITAASQLFVSAEIDYQRRLTPESELQLYRIIQESLSNAVRYAGARAAKVTLRPRDSHALLVAIMDNGKGFDVEEKLWAETSFGLHSILERSKVLGGKAVFSSGPQGTTISIEIPFS